MIARGSVFPGLFYDIIIFNLKAYKNQRIIYHIAISAYFLPEL